MSTFYSQIKLFTDDVRKTLDLITQDIVIDLAETVIHFSPVDSGLFVGNWQMTVGTPSSTTLERFDPDKTKSLSEIIAKAGTLTAGEVVYICNNLDYSLQIEATGWRKTSSYAPVRRTELMFKEIVDAVIRRRKL